MHPAVGQAHLHLPLPLDAGVGSLRQIQAAQGLHAFLLYTRTPVVVYRGALRYGADRHLLAAIMFRTYCTSTETELLVRLRKLYAKVKSRLFYTRIITGIMINDVYSRRGDREIC